jgi:2-polyprenyl-3-methyl-5-hydroxy-6-metoxy-1,4-benzoquinol methylase
MPNCYACGENQTKLWLDGFEHNYARNGVDEIWKYCLMECGSCRLGFIDPMPDSTLLQTFYSKNYHCYSQDRNYDQIDEHSKYVIARMRLSGLVAGSESHASLLKRSAARTVEWFSGKTITYSLGIPLQLSLNAMILEIGYGTGQWLYNMASLGYENLYGYDIDANPTSRTVLESMGVRLSNGVFLENSYPTRAFDCIRLEHVFEHLLDPIALLRKCREMLRPGGSLVMTFPCKHSLSRAISSRHWGPLEPPVHLFHHTPQSAKLVLEAAGFTAIKVKPYSVSDQLAGTINSIVTARGIHLPAAAGWLFRLMAPLYRAVGAMSGTGDFMTVWAKATK